MHDEGLSYRQRGSSRILISLVVMLILLFTFAFALNGCSGPESDTVEQTTSEQAATIQTTTVQTTTSSQIAIRSKFSKEDLIIDGISYGATPEEIDQTLGNPFQQETTMDQVTGLDLLTYTYEGLQLVFKSDSQTDKLFHLKTVEATISGYRFVKGLQVGDPAEKVLDSFDREENVKTYQGYSVLYGDPNLLDSEAATGEVAFGYYDDSLAYFLAMKPPYMSGYATVYDEMAVLQFAFEDGNVTSIRWMLGPGAE